MSSLILRHLSGSKANQELVFSETDLVTPVSIGRDPANRVSFSEADDASSRNHARIESSAEGFKIFDLNSANGLFVNGKRVSGESVVRHGDILQFGKGGPELSVQLDPPPADQLKATRVVANYAPKATREVDVFPVPVTITADAGVEAQKVGRATVERMIGFEKKRSSRIALNLIAVVIGIAGVFVAWQYSASRKVERQIADQDAKLVEQRNSIIRNEEDLINKTSLAKNIKQQYAKATVYLEVNWRLTTSGDGKQIYHKFVREGGKELPCYVRLRDGSIEPWLTTEEKNARPISQSLTGSGFVVSDNGLVVTSRHVAAAWHAPFKLLFPGILYQLDGQGKSQKVSIIQQPTDPENPLLRWVPAESKYFHVKGVADKSIITGKNDVLMATFPGSKLRVSASLGTVSPEADVALIKIDAAAGKLTKVDLRDGDANESLQSGEQVVVLGYPGISEKSYVATESQDVFVSRHDVALITDVSVNQGIISKIPSGKTIKTSGQKIVGQHDYYEMNINSAGPGNSGGPVFDSDMKVVAIYTTVSSLGDKSIISGAVPIGYAIDLLDPTKPVAVGR